MNSFFLAIPALFLSIFFGFALMNNNVKFSITLPDKTEISIESKVQRDHHFEKSPHPTLTK